VKTTADALPRRGAGVVLRRLSALDVAAFQAYRTDTELGRYQGWSAMSDAQACEFLNEMSAAALLRPGEWAQIGVAGADGLALLGDIGLFVAADSRHAEIGFTLARPAQGRGLATAAAREAVGLLFEHTAVERVLGITDARNDASIRVLERIGMRKVGEHDTVFRGEPCVECVYAVLRGGA
jgi:[ribosomal protein S5]-alanine N-acetyltransferase